MVAKIPGDEVDNCSLSEALEPLVRRRVAHEEAKMERRKLASYTLYAYDDPLEDKSLLETATPQRVNPRVPVVRTTQNPNPNHLENEPQALKSLPRARRGAAGAL